MRRLLIAWVAGLTGLVGWGGSAAAADLSFSWDGTVVVIDTNLPGAIHGNVVSGVTPFSGDLVYPDDCLPCIIELMGPNETNYVFPGGTGGLMGGGGTSVGIESSVNIVNDQMADQETVDLAAMLGLTLTLGQNLDVWSAGSETTGEFTPSFVEWDVAYIYATTNPLSNTNYTPTPPPNQDIIIFDISQDNGDVFFVTGEVTSIPEPGYTVMLASAVVGIVLIRRADSQRRAQRTGAV